MNQTHLNRMVYWVITYLPTKNAVIIEDDMCQFIESGQIIYQENIESITTETFFKYCDQIAYIENPNYHKWKERELTFQSNSNK